MSAVEPFDVAVNGTDGLIERFWSSANGTTGTGATAVQYVPTGEAIVSNIAGTPIWAQVATKTLRPVSFSIRQTAGVGLGINRFRMYSGVGADSGVYFDVPATTARLAGPVVGTFDFVPETHELILMQQIITGNVSLQPTRICIAVSFTIVVP